MIEFTEVEGSSVAIDASFVMAVEKYPQGCLIVLSHTQEYRVREDYAEVCERIEKAKNPLYQTTTEETEDDALDRLEREMLDYVPDVPFDHGQCGESAVDSTEQS